MKTLPGSRRQGGEQVELHGGERARAPSTRTDRSRRLDDEAADLDRRRPGRRLPGYGARSVQAPEHGAHPGRELARAERLGHVVVGAELQARDPVGLVRPGR